jgi:hypothetical protein
VLYAETEEALKKMKALYTDKNYFRINEGDTLPLKLEGVSLDREDKLLIRWESSRNDILSIKSFDSDRLGIETIAHKPGTSTVRASLEGCKTVEFTVVVLARGESTGINKTGYLTSAQNLLRLDAPGSYAELTVTGVNIREDLMAEKTLWETSDSSLVYIVPNGSRAGIRALKEGLARITVSNQEAANKLAIDVLIGRPPSSNQLPPYIETAPDLVKMVKGESQTLFARLSTGDETPGFSFKTDSKSIAALTSSTNGLCHIEALDAGQTLITVEHSGTPHKKEVLLVVTNTNEELMGIPYLSTPNNIVYVNEGGRALTSVSLENYHGKAGDGFFTWEADKGGLISVLGSGSSAQVQGLKAGTARLKVTHSACKYPLDLIVNVINPRLAEANPYITSPNIVTLTVGESASVINAKLQGGRPSDELSFSWRVLDTSMVRLHAGNDTAQVKALKEGLTQLIISHPKAQDRTVLLVCEAQKKSDLVISLTENIIRISPADGPRTITANLVGGNASDAQHFRWWSDNYEILDLNYTGGNAVIRPLSTGQTTIHISHPKAAYPKDLIVYISQYSEFAFEKQSVNLKSGEKSFINLEIPVQNVRTRVAYSVEKPGGGDASLILQAGGTDAVCVLDPKGAGTVIVTARLLALSSGLELARAQLLVLVEQGRAASTYINFKHPNIITIDKNKGMNLKAALVGGTTGGKATPIRWKSSHPNIVQLSGAGPGGWAYGDEVRITAMAAGECTLSLEHDEAEPVSVHLIVPGGDAASFSLDRSMLALNMGDKPVAINAILKNGRSSDIAWTVEQDSAAPVIEVSGSGKKLSIRPVSPGKAVIRAEWEGLKAACTVEVSLLPAISFKGGNRAMAYPGQEFYLNYQTVPANMLGKVEWSLSDSSLAYIEDNKAGVLRVLTKRKNGQFVINGQFRDGTAKAACTVINDWGYEFSLNKSGISTIPEDRNDGAFEVQYTSTPASAVLEMTFSGLGTVPLIETGPHITYDSASRCYLVKASNHKLTEGEDRRRASGSFKIKPQGEFSGKLLIKAINPEGIELPDGRFDKSVFKEAELNLSLLYKGLSFLPETRRPPECKGKWSHYDRGAGMLIIGDGETLDLVFKVKEPGYGSGKPVTSARFLPATGGNAVAKKHIDALRLAATNDALGSWRLSHNEDVTNNNYNTNSTTAYFIQAGTIEVKYRTLNASEKSFNIPLYIEVRYCPKNYGPKDLSKDN